MPATTTPNAHAGPAPQPRSILGRRTANLTVETLLLVAALAGLLAGVLAEPEVALILLGIPTAVLIGVGAITTAARVLAR